jgi:N-acylneuraminate cytidylyltransferase
MNDPGRKVVALIPARSGSKRVPDKNIYKIQNHPLLAYAIQAAINTNIFDSVICITDSEIYADIATYYGANVPKLRPNNISTDISPDIDWVKWILTELKEVNMSYDLYFILRPTSPFRTSSTIKRAYNEYIDSGADCLRAIQLCKEHPGKMWINNSNRIKPFVDENIDDTPMHSHQYATLPKIYIQNASLEISKTHIPLSKNKIINDDVYPFITKDLEGFDINNTEDIILLNHYIENKPTIIENIDKEPFSF